MHMIHDGHGGYIAASTLYMYNIQEGEDGYSAASTPRIAPIPSAPPLTRASTSTNQRYYFTQNVTFFEHSVTLSKENISFFGYKTLMAYEFENFIMFLTARRSTRTKASVGMIPIKLIVEAQRPPQG